MRLCISVSRGISLTSLLRKRYEGRLFMPLNPGSTLLNSVTSLPPLGAQAQRRSISLRRVVCAPSFPKLSGPRSNGVDRLEKLIPPFTPRRTSPVEIRSCPRILNGCEWENLDHLYSHHAGGSRKQSAVVHLLAPCSRHIERAKARNVLTTDLNTRVRFRHGFLTK